MIWKRFKGPPVMYSYCVFFVVSLNKLLNKESSFGDLERIDAHVLSL